MQRYEGKIEAVTQHERFTQVIWTGDSPFGYISNLVWYIEPYPGASIFVGYDVVIETDTTMNTLRVI